MRTFYEEWSEYVNRQPAVDELPIDAPDIYNNILPNTKGLNELMQDTEQN